MKTVKPTDTQVNRTEIEILQVGEVSPHNRAIYEAGKTMLIDTISTGREFCKFMISFSTGAIPVYLGILAFILPENYSLGTAMGFAIALPAIIFLLSTIIFAIGYLPVIAQFSLDMVNEIDEQRSKIVQRRSRLIRIGFTLFILGMLMAIVVTVTNLGKR